MTTIPNFDSSISPSLVRKTALQRDEREAPPKSPHGESGFITNIVFKAQRLTGWDGQDVDTEGYEVVSETDPRCVDCNKPVRSLFREQSQEVPK